MNQFSRSYTGGALVDLALHYSTITARYQKTRGELLTDCCGPNSRRHFSASATVICIAGIALFDCIPGVGHLPAQAKLFDNGTQT